MCVPLAADASRPISSQCCGEVPRSGMAEAGDEGVSTMATSCSGIATFAVTECANVVAARCFLRPDPHSCSSAWWSVGAALLGLLASARCELLEALLALLGFGRDGDACSAAGACSESHVSMVDPAATHNAHHQRMPGYGLASA